MENPVSLKMVERQVFQATYSDGLHDIMIGCVLLMFAIAPLLSESLGDLWSSAIFLPFWGLIYLAIWLTRRYVVAPRIGTVTYSKQRQKRLRMFSILMVIANIILLMLGIAVLITGAGSGVTWMVVLGLSLMIGFSTAAYFLDYSRLYLYGLLIGVAPMVGEWLSVNYGAPHHGFPLVFGIVSGLVITIGMVTFVRFLKKNPVLEAPVAAA